MILRTQIRPDRFQRILSGEKKEFRIPVQRIEVTEKRYEIVILTTSYSREALVEIIHLEEDKQTGEYVLQLGKVKSTKNIKTELKKDKDNHYPLEGKGKKKYIQKCEILRDGKKIGILNLSTKQGCKQRNQLGRLQGYTFNELPLEITTNHK